MTLPDVQPENSGAFLRGLDLRAEVVTAEEVRGHIEVTSEHHTPWGITHGGVYAAAIESAASLGASMAVRERGQFAVGVNNQTDFLRPHVQGRLDVIARPVQQGRSLQLWLVDITNADGKTIARGQVRLFNQALPNQAPSEQALSNQAPR